jgi:hypothetical protein
MYSLVVEDITSLALIGFPFPHLFVNIDRNETKLSRSSKYWLDGKSLLVLKKVRHGPLATVHYYMVDFMYSCRVPTGHGTYPNLWVLTYA